MGKSRGEASKINKVDNTLKDTNTMSKDNYNHRDIFKLKEKMADSTYISYYLTRNNFDIMRC